MEKKVKDFFKDIKYSDVEPVLIWIGIFIYLFQEYFGEVIPALNNVNLIPIFVVGVLKLVLNKLDGLLGTNKNNVGYLTDMVDECMKRRIKCKKLRIFSYDSQGFYHAILGKDFFADEIVVFMHKNAYDGNTEILERWKLLIKKKKTDKVTIKVHNYNRFAYGMTFDYKSGVFGTFKPYCVVKEGGVSSTFHTYFCNARYGEAERQAIEDFNSIFDEINGKIEKISEAGSVKQNMKKSSPFPLG